MEDPAEEEPEPEELVPRHPFPFAFRVSAVAEASAEKEEEATPVAPVAQLRLLGVSALAQGLLGVVALAQLQERLGNSPSQTAFYNSINWSRKDFNDLPRTIWQGGEQRLEGLRRRGTLRYSL